MARKAVSISVARTIIGSEGFGPARGDADPVATSGYAAAKTAYDAAAVTLAADLATLVADGASPTQAHVTTVNADYTALAAAYTTFAATLAAPPSVTDVVLSYNAATVASRSILKRAVERLLRAVEGDNSLTA